MKKFAFVIVLLALALTAPVVWGQAYPTPAAVSALEPPPLPLAEAKTALAEEEERLERLRAEATRLDLLAEETDVLVKRARAAKAEAVGNPAVSPKEFAGFQNAVATAVKVRQAVADRLELFRHEVAGAEKDIARLKRAVLLGELEAEAARLQEAASGK